MSIVLLALSIFYPMKSTATPPRVVVLDQRIIGLNENGIYTRFTIGDNLGLHSARRLDEYLAQIDLNTGSLVNIFPIRSTLTDTVNSIPGDLKELPVKDPINVDQFFIENHVAPYLEKPYEIGGYKIKNEALITNFNDPSGNSGAKTLKSKDALLAIAQSQFNPFAARYPELSDEEFANFSGEFAAVKPIQSLTECEVVATYFTIRESMDGSSEDPRLLPVKIQCYDGDFSQIINFFVFVNDWTDTNF